MVFANMEVSEINVSSYKNGKFTIKSRDSVDIFITRKFSSLKIIKNVYKTINTTVRNN